MIVGTGVDVIEIARISRALAERGERFERRVFTPSEIARCRAAGRAAPHFAMRFAAKEAVMKAVGTGWARGVRWVDIETVVPEPGGRLSDRLDLHLHGVVGELAAGLGERLGLAAGARPTTIRTHLAVGRSRTHAMATVLLEARPT